MTKPKKPKIGRPRNAKCPGYDADKLTTISARVTRDELATCAERATALGLKVSEYLRALVRWDLNQWPHDQPGRPNP